MQYTLRGKRFSNIYVTMFHPWSLTSLPSTLLPSTTVFAHHAVLIPGRNNIELNRDMRIFTTFSDAIFMSTVSLALANSFYLCRLLFQSNQITHVKSKFHIMHRCVPGYMCPSLDKQISFQNSFLLHIYNTILTERIERTFIYIYYVETNKHKK